MHMLPVSFIRYAGSTVMTEIRKEHGRCFGPSSVSRSYFSLSRKNIHVDLDLFSSSSRDYVLRHFIKIIPFFRYSTLSLILRA